MTLKEVKLVIEAWRWEYNEERTHSTIGIVTPQEFIDHYQINGSSDELTGYPFQDRREVASYRPVGSSVTRVCTTVSRFG